MDSNTYPDLAVGALHSSAVLLLRTQPIVRLEAFVRNNATIQHIDQHVKSCRSEANAPESDLVCFSFDLCFKFTSANVSPNGAAASLPALLYTLEAEPNVTDFNTRVYFSKTNAKLLNGRVDLYALQVSCDQVDVYIKKDNSDFLRALKFSANYTFAATENRLRPNSLLDIQNHPIIHQDSNSFQFEANFKKDCGQDKKCLTDLRLSAFFADLIIGDDQLPLLSFKESDTVTITVLLENNAADSEPAYTTQIDIDFDDRLDFTKKHDHEPNGFTCAINYKRKAKSLICKMTNDIGGAPFQAHSFAKFNLTFSATRLYRFANITSRPSIVFNLEANTYESFLCKFNNNYFYKKN